VADRNLREAIMLDGETLPRIGQHRSLRVLFLEDKPDDLELCVAELRKTNLTIFPDIVKTLDDFSMRLQTGSYDAVVAAYRPGSRTGMDALTLMRGMGNELPFILIALLTGVPGEGSNVSCIKRGLSHLVPAIRPSLWPQVIRRATIRPEERRKKSDENLPAGGHIFSRLAGEINSGIFVYLRGKCQYVNREAENITGYSRSELLLMDSLQVIHVDSREIVTGMGFCTGHAGVLPHHFETQIVTKSGETRWLDITACSIEADGGHGWLFKAFDITKRKMAFEEMQRLATSDALTGLANYRRLLEAFDSELDRSQRTGRSFSLLFMDLDRLKNVNDTHGHAVGSRALRRVGTVLQAQCRSLDTPARYGGDEFAVLMPETKASAAGHLADRIADAIRDDAELPRISVSFGLASCPEDGQSFQDILEIADSRLYMTKGYKIGLTG